MERELAYALAGAAFAVALVFFGQAAVCWHKSVDRWFGLDDWGIRSWLLTGVAAILALLGIIVLYLP